MDLSIIIVNWNTREMLKDCLSSIRRTKENLKIQIIVVDNRSSDGSREMIQNFFPEVHVINSGANLGFARANNLAIPYAKAPLILFLNPDTIVKKKTLITMLDFMNTNPDVGAIGCKAINLDGKVQDLGLQWFPSPFTEFINFILVSEKTINKLKYLLPYKNSNYSDYVSKLYGLCLMVKKVVFDQVGYFDERFFMYCEDVDLCHRITKNGWKLYYLSEIEIIHIGGGASSNSRNSFSTLMMRDSISKLIEKYYGKFGVIRYRFAVLTGSHVRMLFLVVLKIISYIRYTHKKENLNVSFKKYLTTIKWSLYLQKPVIKN